MPECTTAPEAAEKTEPQANELTGQHRKQRAWFPRKGAKTTSRFLSLRRAARRVAPLLEVQARLARDGSLPGPDDRSAATVDTDLSIQGGDVITHGVFREVEFLAHLEITVAFAYEPENLALAVGEEINIQRRSDRLGDLWLGPLAKSL